MYTITVITHVRNKKRLTTTMEQMLVIVYRVLTKIIESINILL